MGTFNIKIEIVELNCYTVHCSPFIMLCLGSIGMDRVISKFCFKRTILQRNYRKMTILQSFSCNSC